ncbi:hypothetical protein [Streptomyces sp. NPDC058548]|uniref:hypothetical protein n=1 Tax=unclassified Streptomyces TaxID=2593676 RepID=UPI0036698910
MALLPRDEIKLGLGLSSALSRKLLDALLSCDARVLAVHVVARESVIAERLRARVAEGGAVDRQLSSQFQRGEMKRSIFQPPSGVDAVVEVDTVGFEPTTPAPQEREGASARDLHCCGAGRSTEQAP